MNFHYNCIFSVISARRYRKYELRKTSKLTADQANQNERFFSVTYTKNRKVNNIQLIRLESSFCIFIFRQDSIKE